MAEISRTEHPTGDPDQIRSDVEAGLVSRETASLARGWAAGEAKKAQKEKAEVEALRLESQMAQQEANLAARGLDDGDPDAARREKDESQNPENNADGEKRVRGEGRNTDAESEEED